ncbi:MAG: glycosyltransferase [Bryobacteraceae bacterium]
MVRAILKRLWFGLLGKDPKAIVVTFWSGDDATSQAMVDEIRQLVPDRAHYVVRAEGGSVWRLWREQRRAFRSKRIGLAPVLFTKQPHALRLAAFLLAPTRILAYNLRLERHHLKLSTWIASLLFLRGVPLDRIYLRPRWLWPWRRERSVYPDACRILDGRPMSSGRKRVGVLSPYFPYPLSHGGAVRIFHLLKEASREFDVFLLAFSEKQAEEEYAPVLEFCAKVVVVPLPRYREPRWSSLRPPEVCEYDSPAMREALKKLRAEYSLDLLQVEYTHLATYAGDVLVEHDVTFDLHAQVSARERTWSARWNYYRWKRFETKAIRQFRRVVTMSEKDAAFLHGLAAVRTIENGADLERFHAVPERPGMRLLFVGSFRHFPNVEAFRFFHQRVWPRLRDRFPEMTLTVVCGADHLLHWRTFTGERELPSGGRIELHAFVRDVRPLYEAANIAIVPTPVSAGTNVKVLEAMAMERAVVSTDCGCAGLGLEHGASVWIADTPEAFSEGVVHLAENPELRRTMARNARELAERRFGWRALGEKQRALYRELLSSKDGCG